MQTIIAINRKHQSRVNKAVKSYERYSATNNLRDAADGQGDTKTFRKYDRMCSEIFDKYLDILYELPIREVNNIKKHQH